MKKFEIRLAENQRRNEVHRDNLARFIDSERADMIPPEQFSLMCEELNIRRHLDEVLKRRMELLGLPVCR